MSVCVSYHITFYVPAFLNNLNLHPPHLYRPFCLTCVQSCAASFLLFGAGSVVIQVNELPLVILVFWKHSDNIYHHIGAIYIFYVDYSSRGVSYFEG